MPEVASPNQAEREFETGTDEAMKGTNVAGDQDHRENSRVVFANVKRTYDGYQDLDFLAARRAQIQFDSIQALTHQSMQNAVENANALSKQMIRHIELEFGQYKRHSDLAADSFWNPVSAGAGMNLTAGAVPSNRNIDQETAVAGGAVANSSAAVASAVAKQFDATVTPVLLSLQKSLVESSTQNAAIAALLAQLVENAKQK